MTRAHILPLDDAMKNVPEQEARSMQYFESQSISRRPVWRKYLHRFISSVYFEKITLIHPERLPKTGPCLYLGLHRNGAVDGFVYSHVLNEPVFLISTQLRKNWFARIFFDGIAVTRTKDEGEKNHNDEAMQECRHLLQAGGTLFVFPEGTSSLGPRHLPFKSGAIWLLLDYLDSGGPPLPVVPVGIYYECPWAFRSKVEVVPGKPITMDLPKGASRTERLKIMRRRVQTALEEVGINVGSNEFQEEIQRIAYASTLDSPRSYFKSLKALEHGVPEEISRPWQKLEPDLRNKKLWFHQGVPLFSSAPPGLYLAALMVIGPVVFAAMAMNLPALAAGWVAGKKFPDDRNVISLWKILAGTPACFLWLLAVITTTLVMGKIWWLATYAAITWLGLKLYCRFKKLAAAVHNTLRQPALRPEILAFHQTVLQTLPNEAD